MADERAYTGGHVALDLMGASAGFLKKFDGLDMAADVVTSLGPDNIQKKQVAGIRSTPAKARVGSGIGSQLASLIQSAFKPEPKPFYGALRVTDYNYKVQMSVTFGNAIMTAVTFPKMDGSSRDPAYFDLEWEAEQVSWVKGDGAQLVAPTTAQKAWLSSNFRFEMGGLPCSRVATIDAFTWQRVAGNMTVPNIKVEVSRADFDPWFTAAKKWFVDGANQERNEMAGAIVFLAPDLVTEIGRLTLKNCGFARFMQGPFEETTDTVARFSCEFYVEAMEFTIK